MLFSGILAFVMPPLPNNSIVALRRSNYRQKQFLTSMFSLNQIHEAHSNVKSGADFPRYVRDLKEIGVSFYDTYVSDGTGIYFGDDDYSNKSGAEYPAMEIAGQSSAEALKHALEIHQQGQTDYPAFCRQAADSGVEKWTTDAVKMNVAYFDKTGRQLVVETIPDIQ